MPDNVSHLIIIIDDPVAGQFTPFVQVLEHAIEGVIAYDTRYDHEIIVRILISSLFHLHSQVIPCHPR